ncbi:MAG TPA: hypothetical protein VNZ56_04735 [Verrucomicrobiae bacterium]|jgi:hypothetical protein|nr:hypothetical protein [Verrucomicrobiae bacterium]
MKRTMNRTLLLLLILLFFRVMAAAQQERANGSTGQTTETALVLAGEATGSVQDGGSPALSPSGDDSDPGAADPAKTKKPKPPPKPVDESQFPTIQDIKVGYLDSAIIGSGIRFRFDAAFKMIDPDRAEYFYAKCGCYADIPNGAPPLFDAYAPGPGPGNATEINFMQAYLSGELAVTPRLSVFAEVPVRSIRYLLYGSFFVPPGQERFKELGGLSDTSVGVKLALLASPTHFLTLQMQGVIPTGDASRGMGTSHGSIVPAILYYRKLSQYWAIDAEFSDSHPISGSRGISTVSPGGFAGDVLFYGVGPSFEMITTENFHLTPVLELVGWTVISGQQTTLTSPASASGTNIANIKWGARLSFGKRSSAYVGFGTALTAVTWYKNIFSVEYRYAF